MAKRRNGRRAKVESGWNRRVKAARVERAAEQADANDWSRTAPRMRAKGIVGRYGDGRDFQPGEQPDT